MGSSVPMAVVVSAMATKRMPMVTPPTCRSVATPMASTSEVSQESTPRRSGAPFMRGMSISNPARKMRNTRPNSASTLITSSSSTQPSTCGPMTMPSRISTTTPGRRVQRLVKSDTNGLMAATATTSTRVISTEEDTAAV